MSRAGVIRVLPAPGDVATAAAAAFAEGARRAVRERGRFTVALSGGSTPAALFRLLASDPWSSRVDWRRTHVFWSDERCVPPDHPDSNYGLAHRTLLSRVPLPASQVHRVRGELEPREAALRYEADLRAFLDGAAENRLDLVLLGLGEDGHTASLFPGSPAFEAELASRPQRWVVDNRVPSPGPEAWRVTFTTRPINTSRSVIVLVTGSAKAEALRRVVETETGAGDEIVPAQLVRPSPGELLWLVDEAAAASLAR